MTYQQALSYFDRFLNYETFISYHYPQAFSLDRMRNFLKRLGDPHRQFTSLHVAGTKGKGSTCIFLASILKRSGRSVGLYTSPHLLSFQERIQVDGQPISESDLAHVVEAIEPHATPDLTYFEVTTACAFLYFAKRKVETAVVEVGLGGRLDATNVLEPRVTGIAPISFDHMEKLGFTLSEIAFEKAGIIKKGIPVVVAPQMPEALQVIEGVARTEGAPLHPISKEVLIEGRVSLEASRVRIKTPLQDYADLAIPLLGRFQWTNAACAIRMAELYDEKISHAAVEEGISQAVWPGRCQWIPGSPSFLLDGAQNAASAQALRETVEELFPEKRPLLILGVSTDKDLKGIARALGTWPKTLIVTKAATPRAQEPEKIAEAFAPWQPEPLMTGSVAEAIDRAGEMAGPEDLVVATGSLFVAAEAWSALAALAPR